MKQNNTELILGYLKNYNEGRSGEISQALNISRSTATRHLKQLHALGLIEEHVEKGNTVWRYKDYGKYDKLRSAETMILFHLLNRHDTKRQCDLPIALTQNGIARALGTNGRFISDTIEKSVAKGYVQEWVGRVKNGKKRQKFFRLTNEGKDYAQRLKEELSNLTIKVVLPDDNAKNIKLSNIARYLDEKKFCSDITELDLYNIISKEGSIDIKHLKNNDKIQFIDLSAEAPMVVHFFGRKREIALLEEWIEDEEGHNLIFIHGIAGIGKTTLAMKLAENYRDSKHIFYHSFHSLDALRGLLSKLAKFLSKLGYDPLEIYLRTHTSLDYYEVSMILRKSIGIIDALLVFDDFHKSNDEIRAFFVYIMRMLASSSKTKIVILSREIVPFYERKYVLSNEIVAELELEGLDFESSKRLLEEKGIDKKMFKEIYKATAGNPLFLELFEIEDERERYVHEEMFSKLSDEERDLLGVISVYRFPVRKEALLFDNISSEALYTLLQKSLVKKNAKGEYFTHDFIKQFFYSRLPLALRVARHKFAARWYKNKEKPLDYIESVYHYVKAGEYEIASKLAVEFANIILDSGLAAEFLVVLEAFDEKVVETPVWPEILLLKGKACYMAGEWKQALCYFNQGVDIASLRGNKKLEVKAICESGHILEEQNELENAMECFKKCLNISKETDYPQGIGEGFRGIGRIYWRKSEHEEAILNFEKCIKVSKNLGNLDLIASAYIDLGNVYDERFETEKAIECYNRSLDILKKVKNPYEIARAYLNLAITYEHINEFDKAIEYNTKRLALVQNLRDIRLIGYGYANISYCFAKVDEFEKARDYAKKAEEIASKIGSENIMFGVYKTYGLICKHEMRWDEAVDYFKKSIEIVEKWNALYYLPNSHFELGLLYEEIGDAKNAERHLNIVAELYDELGLEETKYLREKQIVSTKTAYLPHV